jgi:plasmid stability protein
MPAILIENVPADLHRRLTEQAERNHRSADQELLTIMERVLRPVPPLPNVTPIQPLRPFDHEWLLAAMREGRE